MKPTSEQTRNGAAVSFPPEDLLTLFFRYTDTAESNSVVERPAVVDSSSAYGCVDWYIYPGS